MPTIDPELVVSLSKISDILIKRPGKVNIEGIKRLSNIYGFETFTDTLTLDDNNTIQYNNSFTSLSENGNTNSATSNKQLITRLTLSGKILLIDIDFLNDNTTVKNVSLSSAINIIPLSENTEVMNAKEVEMILFKNLQYRTLDKFNKNLRIISQFDKLSLNSPNDLFNFFNQLSYNFQNIQKFQIDQIDSQDLNSSLTKQQLLNDFENGNLGIGKLKININEKIGLFLKIWEDNRFVNQFIFENYKLKTKEMELPYLIHFKIRERNDFQNEYEFNELENNIRNHNSTTTTTTTTTTAATTTTNTTNNDNNNENDKIIQEEFKKLWYDTNGKWNLNLKENILLNSNFKLLIFEILPCIWIPEDFVIESGIITYEESNEILNNNNYEEQDKIEKLNQFYKFFNFNKFNNSSLKINFNYQLNLLIGCRIIKLYKFKIEDIPNQLELFISRIRSWLLINRLLLNLFKDIDNFKEILENNNNKENADYESDINLTDLIKDTTETNNTENSLTKISISFKDTSSSSDFYISLKINKFKFLIKNGQIYSKENSKLANLLAISEDINKIL